MLIISDLHAHTGDPDAPKSPSYCSTDPRFRSVNPLVGIEEIIRKEGISADWIICPGDLADQADPTAQQYAWERLVGIKSAAKANLLVGTVGNHDVDSRRHRTDFDPKSILQSLEPMFPGLEEDAHNDQFWSRNLVCYLDESKSTRLVLLNSCAFHGLASQETDPISAKEYTHGRLSPATLDLLSKKISKKANVNILVVHHHPIKHAGVIDGGSSMINGENLLNALERTRQRWLVIHGHLHVPRLSYAMGSAMSAVIFSVGSACARIAVQTGTARNQFYLLEIDETAANGINLSGEITAWDWSSATGWTPAHKDSVIPYSCGFGFRPPDISQLADEVISIINGEEAKGIAWRELCNRKNTFRHMIPEDVNSLIDVLEERKVSVSYDRCSLPEYLEV